MMGDDTRPEWFAVQLIAGRPALGKRYLTERERRMIDDPNIELRVEEGK